MQGTIQHESITQKVNKLFLFIINPIKMYIFAPRKK